MKVQAKQVRKYVDHFEQTHPDVPVYAECMQRMTCVDLDRITEAEVTETIEPFLYEWGGIGRILDGSTGWQGRLAAQIRAVHPDLTTFRLTQLQAFSLIHASPEVVRCYESVEEGVQSPVVVGKVLHLICPDFFPTWDERIERDVVAELSDRSGDSSIDTFSVFTYYSFMQAIHDFLVHHDQVLSELAKRYGKGKLKITDEALCASPKPRALLF